MSATLKLSAYQSVKHLGCADLILTIHNQDSTHALKATWKVELPEGKDPIAGSMALSGFQRVHPGNLEQVGRWTLALRAKQPPVEREIEATSILQWPATHVTSFGSDRRLLSQMLQENY